MLRLAVGANVNACMGRPVVGAMLGATLGVPVSITVGATVMEARLGTRVVGALVGATEVGDVGVARVSAMLVGN